MSEFGIPANARLHPDAVAIVGTAGGAVVATRTYRELDDRARRGAHALVAAGVEPGQAVAVMVRNRVEWFEAIHACGRVGAVAVPINTHFKAGEVGWIATDSGARAAVVDADLAGAFADVPDLSRFGVGDDGPSGWDAALAAAPAGGEAVPLEQVGAGDGWPTTMVYTSGTTGRPKGVAIGEHDFRRTAAGFAGMGTPWQIGPGTVHLLVGPAYHSGPAAWAQMHLAVGGTVVVMDRWDAATALDLIERHRVDNSHMVPANFIRILELPTAVVAARDLSSLQLVVHAAAPCPVPVKRAFMDLVGAGTVWEYYGASEGGGTVISPDEWLAHPGSVGRPFPGNEFRILDDEGNEQPAGTPGTIWARTEHSSFRYHNDDQKTASSYRDGGWFSVGDVGYLDADGYLYLTDRKSDMVISGGVNIYPREIENALYEHPDVVDCAVLGVPDERWGESLYAVVQPRQGSTLTADDVRAWCRARLADYKTPRLVELLDELPRDPNGKVVKRHLKQAWLDRR